jgi:hypothetical protein
MVLAPENQFSLMDVAIGEMLQAQDVGAPRRSSRSAGGAFRALKYSISAIATMIAAATSASFKIRGEGASFGARSSPLRRSSVPGFSRGSSQPSGSPMSASNVENWNRSAMLGRIYGSVNGNSPSGIDQFAIAAVCHRLNAMTAHTASTRPKGHAPCKNP